MDIFQLDDIENVQSVFFLRDGMNDPLYLKDSFGNLTRVLTVFKQEKIQKQMRYMLFPNAMSMNLKVSVPSMLHCWKRLRMSPGPEFLEEKEGHHGILR